MRESTDNERLRPRWCRSLTCLVAFLTAMAAHPARAEQPFSLAGHRLGMAYETVLTDPRYDCESLAGCFLYSVCRVRPGAQLQGVPLHQVTLYFQGERLSGVEALFQADRFQEVQGTLAILHGGHAGTGEASTEIAIWEQGSQVLRLERGAGPNRASVVLAERGFLGELLKAER